MTPGEGPAHSTAPIGRTHEFGHEIPGRGGVVGNVPLAAAFATVPVLVMGVFLLLMRRLGAFEAL